VKILIIEDEKELATTMGRYLEGEQYICEFADTALRAEEKLLTHNYDCVLLDLTLPGGDGLKILDTLKTQSRREGVIIISARESLGDKVQGLKSGADDYLVKPFHLSELSARILSVIRRRQFDAVNSIHLGELIIELLAKRVVVKGQDVQLTKKEYDLLLFFAGNKNKVISKTALAEHLSGDLAEMFDNHDFVYAHVKNLKRKLAEAGCSGQIKTVYGTGYVWQDEQTTP
jgi:DNA-binding response OmpR family regulator